MRLYKDYIWLIILAVALCHCNDKKVFSEIPEIEFVGINQDTFNQGRQVNDSIFITIRFRDGDGDIGFENNTANIFLKDNRDGFVNTFSSPVIPLSTTTASLEGTIRVLVRTLLSVCCKYTTGQDPCSVSITQSIDSFYYQIHLLDRAGNKSNEVRSSTIYIRCN